MNKLKYYLNQLSYVINNRKFIITLVASILINMQGVFYIDNFKGLFQGMLTISMQDIYDVLLILFSCINVFTIYDHMENNRSFIIRCKDKKTYNNYLLKNIILTISLIVLLNFLICFIGLVIKYQGLDINQGYPLYKIPYIIYLLFYIIRKIFLLTILVCIIVYIRKIFGKIPSNLLIVIIIALFCAYPYNFESVNSISDIKLFYGYYFIPIEYSNFALEISCSIFICLLLISICFVLYKISLRFNKEEV